MMRQARLNVTLGVVVCFVFLGSAMSGAAANLYRTNAVGTWDDGLWVDETSTPYPGSPTGADTCYIGTGTAPGITDSTVTIDGIGATATNIYLGDESASGVLILTNGASLVVSNRLYIRGDGKTLSQTVDYGELRMSADSALAVSNHVFVQEASWVIDSNHNVTVAGGIYLTCPGDWTHAYLTINGGTQSIGANLDLGNTRRLNTYLRLQNDATLNVGGSLVTGTDNADVYQYITIEPGSMLNIAGDLLWMSSVNTATIPGDGVTVGGYIGIGGTDTYRAWLEIDGGRVVADYLYVGRGYRRDRSELYLNGGVTVSLRRPESGNVNSLIGRDGPYAPNYASLYLGTATDPATIDIEETGGTGTLGLILSDDYYQDGGGAEPMILQGWGAVELDGTLQNNGKVIADGYGSERDLTLTNFAAITQDQGHGDLVDNDFVLTDGTSPGWYAQRGGKLTLPALTGLTAHATVRWGDNINDLNLTHIDPVNSVMLDFKNCIGGDVVGSLADANRTDHLAETPANTVGIWLFDTSAFSFGPTGESQLSFRYDAKRVSDMGLTEADLKVWRCPSDGPYWTDCTESLNATENIIQTTWLRGVSQFAISTTPPGPEPPLGTVILVR